MAAMTPSTLTTPPASTTRLVAFLACVIPCTLLFATPVAAAFVHDPFVSDLRLGAFRDLTDVKLEAGWPAGLLTPLSLDPGWVAAAACLDDRSTTTAQGAPGWRIVVPTLSSTEAALAWYDGARAARDRVVAAAHGDTTVDRTALDGPFAREIMMLAASRAWESGRHASAAALAATLVERRVQLGLDSESAFVWDLRARCLGARAGHARGAMASANIARPDDKVWPLLAELGSYDVRCGWALWVATRRAAQLPVLPPGAATRELGLALASGGEAWLTAAQLRAAGFPADIEAALGAIVLPHDDLADHFARHATPPADGLLQGYWLRGQRRRQPLDGAWYEKLAATAGLKDGHSLDTWRVASEARVLAGQWAPGLRDLDAGLRLMGGDASKAMRRKLRDWTVKSLVLAVTKGRDDDAKRVLASARRHLRGEDAEVFAREAGPWLTRIDPTATAAAPSTRLQRAQAEVIAGRAAAVPPSGTVLPASDVWRERAWRVWSRLGVNLSSRTAVPARSRAATYAAGLRAAADAADPASRHTLACAAFGQFLCGTDAAETVRRWQLSCEITTAGHGAVAPEPTPLPDLITAATTRGDDLMVHALLGVAIATGDLRGHLAAMAVVPSPGLSEDDVLLLQYPLPTIDTLRGALAASPVGADLILAVAKNESLFDPAVRSRAGALGFMQIMPFHYALAARRPGRDHWSQPAVSVGKGAGLLADESRRFGHDPYRVMAAYNAGAGAVQRWDRQLGAAAGRAEFLAWIGYDETRRYVAAVLTDREIYRWLLAEAP
jgi:soluble lytic murein transglycosylase